MISSCLVYIAISKQEIEQLGISFPSPFLSLRKKKGVMLLVAIGNPWSPVFIDSPVCTPAEWLYAP